jgi:hypothetical protein
MVCPSFNCFLVNNLESSTMIKITKTAFGDYMATMKGVIANAKTPELAFKQLLIKLS